MDRGYIAGIILLAIVAIVAAVLTIAVCYLIELYRKKKYHSFTSKTVSESSNLVNGKCSSSSSSDHEKINLGYVDVRQSIMGEPRLLQPPDAHDSTDSYGYKLSQVQPNVREQEVGNHKKYFQVQSHSVINDFDGDKNQHLGKLRFAVRYKPKMKELLIEIIGADDLLPLAHSGVLPYPYVELIILPDTKNHVQTRVHNRTLMPRWDEIFLFEGFERAQLEHRHLLLTVRYRSFQGVSDKAIGEVLEPIAFLADRRTWDRSFILSRYFQPVGTAEACGYLDEKLNGE